MPRLRSLLALAALALALALPAVAQGGVPDGWSGVNVDYPQLLADPGLLDSELGVMRTDGVARVRMALYWSHAQPYRRMSDVPEDERDSFTDQDGVPTDLSGFDRVLDAASRRGIGILPVVLGAPRWAAVQKSDGGQAQPRRPGDYARFLTTLVRRYGSDGSFWSERPDLPYRPLEQWQVWNEPNIPFFWKRPWVAGYAALLRASHRALRAADPHAQLVIGGLTGLSWDALGRLYRAGAKGSFDVLALNTFTAKPANLLRAAELCRRVQLRYGNVTPTLMSEITWDASRGLSRFSYGWSTTPRDQAAKLTEAYTLLARARVRYRILGVFWYSWLSGHRARDPFDYSGLRVWHDDRPPGSTPALTAFKRVAGGRLTGSPSP